MKVLTDATMVMTWNYTDISNQHVACLKCTQYYTAIIGEGNGTPLQYSCLENPTDGGAW